jgi:hypothetical protein
VSTASARTTLAETGDLPLRGPVLSADGTTAYTTDRNRDVVVWDLPASHRLDRPFTVGTGFREWPWFAMSPDGRMLAVPSSPETGVGEGIWLIDTSDLHVVRRIPLELNGSSTPLAFSPDSATLAPERISARGGGVKQELLLIPVRDLVHTLPSAPSSRPLAPGPPPGKRLSRACVGPEFSGSHTRVFQRSRSV